MWGVTIIPYSRVIRKWLILTFHKILFRSKSNRDVGTWAALKYSCFDSFIKIGCTYILFKWRRILLDHHFNESYRDFWTLDARVGRWTLDARLWTLNSGCWTLDAGRWTMESGPWTLSLTVVEQNQNPVSVFAWLNDWKFFRYESLRIMITLVL